jgi:hypothetical protein
VITDDGELIPSFVAEGEAWVGAIYAMREGRGPELVMRCAHTHHTMHRASACASAELAFAKRVVELAERHREIAP